HEHVRAELDLGRARGARPPCILRPLALAGRSDEKLALVAGLRRWLLDRKREVRADVAVRGKWAITEHPVLRLDERDVLGAGRLEPWPLVAFDDAQVVGRDLVSTG